MRDAVHLHAGARQRELERVGLRRLRAIVIFTGVPTLPRMRSIVSLRFSTIDRHVVDREDRVAGEHAGAFARACLRSASTTLTDAVLERDFDADAGILAGGADADLVELLGIEERRVRIEVGDHAADRRFDQLLVGDVLDVVLAHVLEHFGEQARILPRHRCCVARGSGGSISRSRLHRAAHGQAEAQHDADREDQQKRNGMGSRDMR